MAEMAKKTTKLENEERIENEASRTENV